MNNEENEKNAEYESEKKSRDLFDKLCLWLNEAEIDYQIVTWDSLEGKDIIINPQSEHKCAVAFYKSGRIFFNDPDYSEESLT